MGDDAIGRIMSPPLADAPASAARPDPIPVTPLTFALCSRCGERQPGAECMQPACVAVRKQVAARKAEEATRGKIAALANVVSLAVEQWPGVNVSMDPVGPKGSRGPGLLVKLSSLGARREIMLLSHDGSTLAAAAVRDRCTQIVQELGARALGKGAG